MLEEVINGGGKTSRIPTASACNWNYWSELMLSFVNGRTRNTHRSECCLPWRRAEGVPLRGGCVELCRSSPQLLGAPRDRAGVPLQSSCLLVPWLVSPNLPHNLVSQEVGLRSLVQTYNSSSQLHLRKCVCVVGAEWGAEGKGVGVGPGLGDEDPFHQHHGLSGAVWELAATLPLPGSVPQGGLTWWWPTPPLQASACVAQLPPRGDCGALT